MDFKKAFDTVKHSILIKKLEHYGICGVTLDLLTSFLTNRKQYVAHKDNFSDVAINRFGVPQGSNLRPLLFLIYINDISNAQNSTPRLFADDACIIIHQSNQPALTEKTNRKLANVHKLTQANKITVNPQKSSSLVIPPKTTNNTCDVEISFDNSIKALQDSVKYFGITIDSELKFNLHMALESKIARSIGVISKLKQVFPISALRTLYYSMIHPHLLYGIVIWGSTFKTYLGKLSVLQNKALRIVARGNW